MFGVKKLGLNKFWDNNLGGGVHMLGIKLFGGAKIEWSACAMGKRGTPLANAISFYSTIYNYI